MTYDDGLHRVDSVHADDFAASDDPELTDVRSRRVADASPQPSPGSRVAITQHDENAAAVLQSVDDGSACGAAVAGDDEIDGSHQYARCLRTGSRIGIIDSSLR